MIEQREQAFAAAFNEIERVRLNSEDVLDFRRIRRLGELASHLDRIPPNILTLEADRPRALILEETKVIDLSPLAGLTWIQELSLAGSPVQDISVIRTLPNLRRLFLSATDVADLSPLLDSALFQSGFELAHIRFENTPASRADPRLAEIAAIQDDRERAKALYDHLRNQVSGHEPEPLLGTVFVDGKLELETDPPTEGELAEELKRSLHLRLRDKAAELALAAGNAYPKLAGKARRFEGMVSAPFAELDLFSIHLEIGDLEARRTEGREDDLPYSDDVRLALEAITRIGPALTVGHPWVELFEQRTQRARATPYSQAVAAVHDALSRAIIAAPEANGPRSIAMERLATEAGDPAVKQAVQEAKHKNILVRLGMAASAKEILVAVVRGAAEYVGMSYVGPPLVEFVRVNGTVLMDVALSYGWTFAGWFMAVMGPVFIALGLEEEVSKRIRKDEPE